MYKLLAFLFTAACFSGSAQEAFVKSWQIPIEADCTWDADQAGNVYLFHKQTLIKLDTSGRQLLTQSVKSFGTIAKIDAANWLKIAIFSEEQQQVCYLDNALGIQPNCIDLTELGVDLAQNFATSTQTDRLWVYDQLNSELQLITIRTNQRQFVQNLRSLVDLGNVLQLMEFQNSLYLLDDRGQIMTFDNFGSFLGSVTIPSTHMQPFKAGILTSTGCHVVFNNREDETVAPFFDFPDPSAEIELFYFVGRHLYVSTKDTFYCFALH